MGFLTRHIDTLIHKLSSPGEHVHSHRLFVRVVYGWMIIQALLLWTTRELIWGPETILKRYSASKDVIGNLVYSLMYDLDRFPFVYYPHILLAVISMFDFRWAFIPRALTWFTGLMLFFAGIPAYNSGMLLMLLLAFYCIPVFTNSKSPFRQVLNHFARYAAILQIALCYLFSSLFKLMGDQWLDGSAVYYALHIDRFSQPWLMQTGWGEWKIVWTALTYMALGYQILFPFVIWFTRHRNWFLITGVCLHLFICVIMNLWDFGLAMIACYALFLSEPTARRIENLVRLRTTSK